MTYTLQTGNAKIKLDAKNEEAALKKFLTNLKAEQFGIMVSIEYFDSNVKHNVGKFTPTEIALKKLGLYSKFRNEIEFLRKEKKDSKRDVIDYDS